MPQWELPTSDTSIYELYILIYLTEPSCKVGIIISVGQRAPVPRLFLTYIILAIFFFCYFRAAPTAYGDFQARGQIEAVAASLHHSHSNMGSELHLQPIPQLTAVLNP